MDGNTYKVMIEDREYTSWTYYNMLEYKEHKMDVSPIIHKLLNEDVIMLDGMNNVKIIHSTLRKSTNIPGVIILKNNKTYGRAKNGKLLYKCIPDDKRLPVFLVPYEMKNMGFSKVFINQYVTFQYGEWVGKHPQATLTHMIGSVDTLDNFYEYQLYCKSLNASIQKFTKDTNKAIKNHSHDEFIDSISKRYVNIEDRSDNNDWKIFSIDPVGSVDFDDAFSIKNIADGTQLLSIYISNVTVCLDVLNLWDSFSQRISTIYLPDKKRPMLPTILSDCLCSLLENRDRIALVMDIIIKDGDILDMKYSNVKINVFKNYRYDEKSLLNNSEYKHILETARQLSRKYKYTHNIRDSHDLVSYLMILMNYQSAKTMMVYNNGILRSSILNQQVNNIPDTLPDDVSKFIKIWNSTTGKYIDASKIQNGDIYSHDLLEVDSYIHITSPIRRIVDLLNIIKLQENLGIIKLSDNAGGFYTKWIDQLEYINTTMRYIRKVQIDCSLLRECVMRPELLDKEYNGYIFDKIERSDGLFHYVIYFPEMKMTSKVTVREEMNNYDCRKFILYIFQDEDNLKRKIRVQLV